jgi:hypothetical protein
MEKVKRQAIKEIVLAKMENFKLKIIHYYPKIYNVTARIAKHLREGKRGSKTSLGLLLNMYFNVNHLFAILFS